VNILFVKIDLAKRQGTVADLKAFEAVNNKFSIGKK